MKVPKPAKFTNNMGSINELECEEFANTVLDKEASHCEFKWTNAGSILIGKTVYLDRSWIGKYPWQAKQAILHEIAHIRTWSEDQTHGEKFHEEFARLVLVHLGTPTFSKDLALHTTFVKTT